MTTEINTLLTQYAESYFNAAIAFSGQRVTVITWYFVAVSAAFAFWVQLGAGNRRAHLRAPLTWLLALAAVLAAGLSFVISRDVFVYWTMAEKATRQVIDSVGGQETAREFFAIKFEEAQKAFWGLPAAERFVLWSLPPMVYAAGLAWTARVVSGRDGDAAGAAES